MVRNNTCWPFPTNEAQWVPAAHVTFGSHIAGISHQDGDRESQEKPPSNDDGSPPMPSPPQCYPPPGNKAVLAVIVTKESSNTGETYGKIS